eukprot:COSAG02_NODE_194_length_29788_cov_20.044090_6_plen_311_part_00
MGAAAQAWLTWCEYTSVSFVVKRVAVTCPSSRCDVPVQTNAKLEQQSRRQRISVQKLISARRRDTAEGRHPREPCQPRRSTVSSVWTRCRCSCCHYLHREEPDCGVHVHVSSHTKVPHTDSVYRDLRGLYSEYEPTRRTRHAPRGARVVAHGPAAAREPQHCMIRYMQNPKNARAPKSGGADGDYDLGRRLGAGSASGTLNPSRHSSALCTRRGILRHSGTNALAFQSISQWKLTPRRPSEESLRNGYWIQSSLKLPGSHVITGCRKARHTSQTTLLQNVSHIIVLYYYYHTSHIMHHTSCAGATGCLSF